MVLLRRMHRLAVALAAAALSPAATQACPLQPQDTPASYPECAPDARPLLLDGPHSCAGAVCVYADRAFRGGLVAATTPDNAARLAALAIAASRYERAVVDPAPFDEAPVPGKGAGLVASARIRRGDYVMVQTPSLLVQLAAHETLPGAVRDGLYAAAVQRLPAEARRVFLRQLMGGDVYAKVETNCFRLALDGREASSMHLGCFPPGARLNHDCRPNLQYHITNLTQTIVALRDIAPGEELTVSYIDAVLPRAERQARLRDWGFACACALCRLDAAASAAADARIRALADLTRQLERRDNAAVTAGDGARLVRLYEAERLDIYLGHALTRAALHCAMFGDAAGAVGFARRAAEALPLGFGPAAPDVAPMQRLAADPTHHWAWRLRVGGVGGGGAASSDGGTRRTG